MSSIIDAVKEVYSGREEKALIYDEHFNPLWSNTDAVGPFGLDDLTFDSTVPSTLPLRAETVCRLKDSLAVRIIPLTEEGKLCAYLLKVYDLEDVQQLFAHSAKQKEQEVLIGNVRNSLSSLGMTAEMLRRNPLYYAADAAREIRQALLRTLASVTNQTTVNRICSGKVKLAPVNASAELENSASEAARFLDSEICSLRTDIAPGIILKANWIILESAVLNLIVNAYMYCNAMRKEITLTLERKGNEAVITVSDNGTDADLERIERLSHYASREIEFKAREGLGLPLARKAAELFGGRLTLEPSPTGGLTAVIILPCPETDIFTLRSPTASLPYFPFEYQLCILAKAKDIDI